jgi:hypothetical protein
MRQLGRVSATVRSASGASAETKRVSDILAQAVRGDADVAVTTETVAIPYSQSIGGTRMTIAGGTNWCTSGWTVLHNILGSGVTSAGHCTDQTGIRHQLDNGVIHPAFEVSRHHSTYGDVGWYTTDAAEPGIFYATATVTRNTMSIDSVFIAGETICNYSRLQNSRNCSVVVDNPSVSINYGGSVGIVSQLVRMSGSVTVLGDSGSGWSFDNRASGGHSGFVNPTPSTPAGFSVATPGPRLNEVTVPRRTAQLGRTRRSRRSALFAACRTGRR